MEGTSANIEQGMTMLSETLSSWAEKDETAEYQGVAAWLQVKLILYTYIRYTICMHAYIEKMRRLSIRVL